MSLEWSACVYVCVIACRDLPSLPPSLFCMAFYVRFIAIISKHMRVTARTRAIRTMSVRARYIPAMHISLTCAI